MCIHVCVCTGMFLRNTSDISAMCDTRSFLKYRTTDLNSKFSSRLVALLKLKRPLCCIVLHITEMNEKKEKFMPFPSALEKKEM